MKALVMGIATVFCLQLGFVAYSSIDRSVETMFAINEVTTDTNPVAEIPEDMFAAEVYTAAAPLSSRRVETRKISIFAPRPQKRALLETNTLAFEKTVIEYDAGKPLEISETVTVRREEPAASIEPPPMLLAPVETAPVKKRSIFSKSLSVIKKPYNWLKALATR